MNKFYRIFKINKKFFAHNCIKINTQASSFFFFEIKRFIKNPPILFTSFK